MWDEDVLVRARLSFGDAVELCKVQVDWHGNRSMKRRVCHLG